MTAADAPPESSASLRAAWAGLAAILALAEFLRLPYLLHPWLKDQVAIHAVVADLTEGRAHSAFPMPYTTTAFHRLLGALFGIFGESVLLPRVLAAALAAATTVATFVLARRLFGSTAALVAALLTATSPLLLSTPAVGLPNDPLVLLVSLLFLHSGLRRRSALLVAGSSATIALGLYVRFFYGPALPIFGLMCLALAPRGHRLRLSLAFGGAAVAVGLPLAWILLGTADGLAVLTFTRKAVSGTSTMHTAMGQAMGTPVLQRLGEATVTVHQILLGRMNVGGLMHAVGANWAGLATGLGGVLLAGLRALRPREGKALEDRFLLLWMAGAFAVLVLVVAWPSEIGDPTLGPYRAPRYFILLFPAPWIAAGALVERCLRPFQAAPRGLALFGLCVLATTPSSPSNSLALLTGRTGRVVTEARDATAAMVEAIALQTGQPPLVLADVPPGDVLNWRRPRFALRYEAFLAELDGPEAHQAWRHDQRLGLALDYSQMLYQVEPDLYELDLVLGGRRTRGRINLLDLPFPPLQPILDGSAPAGPAVPHVVVVSSSPGAAILRQRVPGVHEDKRIDRIARFERMNPQLPRSATILGATLPAYALYRVDLAPRVWSNLSLRFGLPEEALQEPDRPWAFPATLYRPELGYGFSHALLEVGRWRNAGQGLLPRYPVTFSVSVPADGTYEGWVTLGRGCQSPAGVVVLDGVVLSPDPDTRCQDDSNVIWLPERYRFCGQAKDGRITLGFRPRPLWTTPWLIEDLQLRRADGTPAALRLGGCSDDDVPDAERDQVRARLALRAARLVQAAAEPPGDPLPPGADLLAAHAVADGETLYARFALAGPPDRPLRFWVEQDGTLVGVTAKVGDARRRCEVALVGGERSVEVAGCFWSGPAGLDLRVPLSALAPLDPTRPLWVTGFQSCCRTEAPGEPFDALDGAQEVQRLP